jgi:mannose-6-phosphate isomerase-like protein (cupin superfamily)
VNERFELSDIARRAGASGPPYLEFLRRASMSAGLYVLEPGDLDAQQPHNEDELYFVLTGRASLDIDGDRQPVSAGSAAFVAAHVPHRFVDIRERLEVLVFFAPAET